MIKNILGDIYTEMALAVNLMAWIVDLSDIYKVIAAIGGAIVVFFTVVKSKAQADMAKFQAREAEARAKLAENDLKKSVDN